MATAPQPFTCPLCGGRLSYEAWEPVHYPVDPQTGAIGPTGRRQGEALDSEPVLVCKNQNCHWAVTEEDITTNLAERRVVSFKP